jgi:hypothetical protein
MKAKTILAITILAGILTIPSICLAGALGTAIRHWEPAGIYGRIMNVENEIITVREHKAMLVDDRIGRNIYRTSIRDLNGNNLDSSSLRIGVYIVVKGTGAYDPVSKSDVVVAKDIYVLPQQMTEDQMNKYPILSEITSPW